MKKTELLKNMIHKAQASGSFWETKLIFCIKEQKIIIEDDINLKLNCKLFI
jgi:hypothetical protein